MKAIVCTKYGPPAVLQLKEVEKPVPRKNEVCIKIFATAVTASDCIVRGFKLPRWSPLGLMMGLALGFRKPRQPILGMVLAGNIESVGKDVKRFKKGDQVYGMTYLSFGTYAEYKCMSEKECLVKKPSNASYEEAAAVAYGANGTAAVQLAKHYGAEVTGVCSTTNLELVKSLGADKEIDYTKEDLISRGELYDFIFDAVGKKKSSKLKSQCKKMLTKNGIYMSVDRGSPKSLTEYLVLLNELIEAGHFKAVIDRRYLLEQIVEAHRYVDKGHKKGNVIITVEHNSKALHPTDIPLRFIAATELRSLRPEKTRLK